jgi:hypothetical protein
MRVARVFLGLCFVCQLAVLDVFVRGTEFYRDRPRMSAGLLASVALLALTLHALHAKRFWVRALVALALGALVASTLGYYRYYHAPLDAQTVVAARHAWADVKPMLMRGLPVFVVGTVLLSALELAVIAGGAGLVCRRRSVAVVLVLGVAITGSPNNAPAEFRTVAAAMALLRGAKGHADSRRSNLPELTSTRARLPNVLFIITESVRASDSCLGRGCATSPELDRLVPDRITFQRARSISSYTAIALSGILTGQTQLKSRRELARVPDLFDVAHAVRAQNGGYSIHYWSSQMAGVLERGALETVADDVITAETLLGHPLSDIEDAVEAILDRRVGDVCERQLRRSDRPAFIVVHLSGTHAPYAFDEKAAKVQPFRRQVAWSGLSELHNAYLNSILEQDHTLGRCIGAYLKATADQPRVIVYTSDHGEAFGEHSAIHHGQNLYDEQIRVPFIVAGANGAFTATQLQALEHNSLVPVTHLDILPTLLELWGVRGHLLLQTWESDLLGRSLLASAARFAPLPISNCTELFPCPLNTWGMLGADKKLTAQSWDGNWRCLSLAGLEVERSLGECADLEKAACRVFPRLPNGEVPSGCH